MPAIITEKKTFFRPNELLKYITCWDDEFGKHYGNTLRFYPGDPKYIVLVSIYADKDKLKPEDIRVSVGTLHNFDEHIANHSNIEDLIKEKSDEIFEICKSCYQMEFLLNLKTLAIVTIADFTDRVPKYGLNTLFMFNTGKDDCIKCVVNTNSIVFKTDEIYSWLLAYSISCHVSIQPMNKPELFAKQFLQALGCSVIGKDIVISKDRSILNGVLSDSGELTPDVPGSVARLNKLYVDSIQEKKKQMEKRQRMEKKHAS